MQEGNELAAKLRQFLEDAESAPPPLWNDELDAKPRTYERIFLDG